MANNIAAETSVNNDAILWCEITKDTVNPTTGVIENAPVNDATDVRAFFSATKELSSSTATHADLTFLLTCPTGTNRYYAYPTGDAMRIRLLPAFKDLPVFVHFLKGVIAGSIAWHEVAQTIIVDERAAA